jgi:hypothetical protein
MLAGISRGKTLVNKGKGWLLFFDYGLTSARIGVWNEITGQMFEKDCSRVRILSTKKNGWFKFTPLMEKGGERTIKPT